MIRQARSKGGKNDDYKETAREVGERNMHWFERMAADMRASSVGVDVGQWTYIVLLGGSDTTSFRIRVAQSHLRSDMLPSLWSHTLVLQVAEGGTANATAIYVPLSQPDGVEFPVRTNGVVARPFADFDDPDIYRNVSLIALPVPQRDILIQLERFTKSRPVFDTLEYVLRWLAFVWGAARTTNPLHDNYGLPTACMLDAICSAAGYDLTPGLESRSSCPEAISIAVLHWAEYYTNAGKPAPVGRYTARHEYDIKEPPHRQPFDHGMDGGEHATGQEARGATNTDGSTDGPSSGNEPGGKTPAKKTKRGNK